MSLRVLYQAVTRVMLGMKEQVSKCNSSLKTLRDPAGNSSSTKQSRRLSEAIDSGAFKAPKNDRLKQAEDSLRTVMRLVVTTPRKLASVRGCSSSSEEEDRKSSERRTFLTLEEAGLVEISGLSTHERFLCRLTISSLNLLRVISEQEGCAIEELNAGKVCDWFVKDKLKREQNLGSAVLQWDDSDSPF
ncbi:hypothetical protein FNV43_RR07671 [Rhamnella rubrinervis]|uniref:Receptor-interacting protein n=1 Tax=Rhamnella rubrinervis TaxID=2594499 RepID=A0A8K0HF71_9ROSA|nr:hypothetical protein FNV43_RR07671 [Rhamnella rubrinervis]